MNSSARLRSRTSGQTPNDSDLRNKAVQYVNDPVALAHVVKNSWHADVQEAAVRRMTDQNLLAEIAKNEREFRVSQAAVERVTDQALLIELATECGRDGVRALAVKRVTDQAVLVDIAKHDENSCVRWAATQGVSDAAVRDRLFVAIALKDLDERSLSPEWAQKLITIARTNPRLIQAKWDQIAAKIQHVDVTRSHSDYEPPRECQYFHQDERDHTDCGLRFPPKPTDF